MNRPTCQRCARREIPPAAEGGGFEPPVREPVRQFSKLLVSATLLPDVSAANRGVISLIAGAKVRLFFELCKFLSDFFYFSLIFSMFPAIYRFSIPFLSGLRDSNPRPSAWEANALPTELNPLVGRKRSQTISKFDSGRKASR